MEYAVGESASSEGPRLAAITLAVAFALHALDRVLHRWLVPDTRRQQFELQQEVGHLQRQAALLNHPDTFAQSAKAERKAIALDKELSRLRQQQAEANKQRVLSLPLVLRILFFAWLALQSGKVPVVGRLQPEVVWPLGRWLSVGAGRAWAPGAVGLLAWAMLCQRVSVAILGGR